MNAESLFGFGVFVLGSPAGIADAKTDFRRNRIFVLRRFGSKAKGFSVVLLGLLVTEGN